jgi:hypothetical protein
MKVCAVRIAERWDGFKEIAQNSLLRLEHFGVRVILSCDLEPERELRGAVILLQNGRRHSSKLVISYLLQGGSYDSD